MKDFRALSLAVAFTATVGSCAVPSRPFSVSDFASASRRTIEAGGATVDYAFHVEEARTLSGFHAEGAFDAGSVQGALELEIELELEEGEGPLPPTFLRADHPEYFFQAPLLALQGIPRHAWIRVDMTDRRDTGVIGFADYYLYVALTRLPRSLLLLLEVQEDIRSYGQDRYRSRVSVPAALEKASPDDREAMRTVFIEVLGFPPTIEVEAWVDEEGRITQVRLYDKQARDEAFFSAHWREFGVDAAFEPPGEFARPADFVEQF